jgi:hypothetical protein
VGGRNDQQTENQVRFPSIPWSGVTTGLYILYPHNNGYDTIWIRVYDQLV